jgi:hypothetical protein
MHPEKPVCSKDHKIVACYGDRQFILADQAKWLVLLACVKENPEACPFARIPIELVRYILGFAFRKMYVSIANHLLPVSMYVSIANRLMPTSSRISCRILLPWGTKYGDFLHYGIPSLFGGISTRDYECAAIWIPPLDEHDGKGRNYDDQMVRYGTYSMGWFVNRYGKAPCLIGGPDLFTYLEKGSKVKIGDGTRPVLCITPVRRKQCYGDRNKPPRFTAWHNVVNDIHMDAILY